MATRRVTTEKLSVLDFRKTQKDRLRLLALPPIKPVPNKFEILCADKKLRISLNGQMIDEIEFNFHSSIFAIEADCDYPTDCMLSDFVAKHGI